MSTSILGLGGRRIDLEVVVRIGTTTALLGSATLHSTLAVDHYDDMSRVGILFVVLQLLETSLAMAVISAWSYTTAAAVVATSVGTVAVWLMSRTTGLPVTPDSYRVSWLGEFGVACFVLALIAAGLVMPWAVRAWPAWRKARQRSRRVRARLGS